MGQSSNQRPSPRHSDHFDGHRFFNPGGAGLPSFAKVQRMLLTRRIPWPRHVPVAQRRPPARAGQEVVITFVGHATFLLQCDGGNILTDPIYANRAGPFGVLGPKRARGPGVAFADLPEISVVLLSHNHYDHCDLSTLRALERRFSPVFVTPVGNTVHLKKAGARCIEELDWWDDSRTTPVPVTLTPAQHFCARTPFDRNHALWGSFVIGAHGCRVFFAGDSGYGPHFRAIRERCGAVDIALLPIGAYEPRWFMQDIHMNPAEAVQAHLDLGARQSIAMHFGAFQLTPEGIDEPVSALGDALRALNVPAEDFLVLEPGGSFVAPGRDRAAGNDLVTQ